MKIKGPLSKGLVISSVGVYAYSVGRDPANPQAPQPHPAGIAFASTTSDTGFVYHQMPNTIEGDDYSIISPAPNVPGLQLPYGNTLVIKGRFDSDT